jgi:hypothetical protein
LLLLAGKHGLLLLLLTIRLARLLLLLLLLLRVSRCRCRLLPAAAAAAAAGLGCVERTAHVCPHASKSLVVYPLCRAGQQWQLKASKAERSSLQAT